MQRLKAGKLGLLVTTELAARGLDMPILSHVINLDLPTDATHYVHRAGVFTTSLPETPN
jgi:ATP-dependent RNA helicase DeaD